MVRNLKKVSKVSQDNGRIIFNDLDKVSNRKMQDDVFINSELIQEAIKKRRTSNYLGIISNDKYWFTKYDGYFFQEITGDWIVVQTGHIYYERYQNQYVVYILYHDSKYSSGFIKLEDFKKKVHMETQTKIMPDEFKNSTNWTEENWNIINDKLLKYLSISMEKDDLNGEMETYRYIDICEEWTGDNLPIPKIELNPERQRFYYSEDLKVVKIIKYPLKNRFETHLTILANAC